ncbi:MAG: NAD(P)H-dependent glycerol-3-phosphate dehydrogenase [Actinobacteria bacterium]|nr:NAD(P)H-dependent glycerol-3-phosphate dehydrogenase [Actinomycetota bacterium]MBU4490481.1 NAD(P)H-dependent glycerol-3-phosphate dehydrogenase [Actinomycetota bacterium]
MNSKATGDTGKDGFLAVIGAGAWGTTLAAVQAANFHRVNLFTVEPDTCEEIARFHKSERYTGEFQIPVNVMPTTSLARAVEGVSWLIVAVPSHAARDVASRLKSVLAPTARVVLATKGLEKDTGLLSLEVFRQEFGVSGKRDPDEPFVLTGPNLSGDIRRGLPSVAVLAGLDAGAVRRGVDRLTHPLLSLAPYHDPLGAQAAGALKNVYAVGCGMAYGLDWGDNVAAAIIWRGLEETARFAEAIGGDPAVAVTPAGVGDFVATCTSRSSRNHDLGRRMAGDLSGNEGVRGVREGAGTAREALNRSRPLGLTLELLEATCSVMAGIRPPEAILQAACCASPGGTGLEDAQRSRRVEAWANARGLRRVLEVAVE